MTSKITKFDASEYLNTEAAVAEYLNEALGTSDEKFIKTALNTVARAKKIELPTLRFPLTLSAVINACRKLGFDLSVVARSRPK